MEPVVKDGVRVGWVPLVAGEHEAGQVQTSPTCNGLCCGQVRPERDFTLPRLEAVVVREGVRADFLAGGGVDEFDE